MCRFTLLQANVFDLDAVFGPDDASPQSKPRPISAFMSRERGKPSSRPQSAGGEYQTLGCTVGQPLHAK